MENNMTQKIDPKGADVTKAPNRFGSGFFATTKDKFLRLSLFALTIVAITGFIFTVQSTRAQKPILPEVQGSPLHPTFPLLDGAGENVLASGDPVSTMNTCGACHDTNFIEQHSFHSDVGLNDFGAPGSTESGRAWDTSPGLFGKWNPLQYRYLSSEGDKHLDLGTPEWLMTIGVRHVGGGPAVYSQEG